jgi:hypothetical protein
VTPDLAIAGAWMRAEFSSLPPRPPDPVRICATIVAELHAS